MESTNHNLKINSHAYIQVIKQSKLYRKWDWYDQTACLIAGYAQYVAEDL